MSKIVKLVNFLAFMIGTILSESPCGDWSYYGYNNCFKVIDSLVPQTEASSICEIEKSKLSIITSEKEQEHIYNYLKYSNFVDSVWIGIKRMDRSFKTLDGKTLNYTNWDEEKSNNQSEYDCAQISVYNQGKWTPVKCEKRNLVLCEKDQLWSSNILFDIMIKPLYEKFKSEVDLLKKEIEQLKQSPVQISATTVLGVPIGFIYVQFSGQSEPQSLWPETEWENVSGNYSGLFFRAEGVGADAFGQIQEQQTQSIEVLNQKCSGMCYIDEINPSKINESFPGTPYWSGSVGGQGIGLKFRHNTEEIRPRNQAIRIWKRIK